MHAFKFTSTNEQTAGKYATVLPFLCRSTITTEFPRSKFGLNQMIKSNSIVCLHILDDYLKKIFSNTNHAYACISYCSSMCNFRMPLKMAGVKAAELKSIGFSTLLCARMRMLFNSLINLLEKFENYR